MLDDIDIVNFMLTFCRLQNYYYSKNATNNFFKKYRIHKETMTSFATTLWPVLPTPSCRAKSRKRRQRSPVVEVDLFVAYVPNLITLISYYASSSM